MTTRPTGLTGPTEPEAPPPDIEAPIPGTLPELVAAIAGQFDDVTRHETPAGIDYLVRDRPFVRVAGERAAFRLRPEIAVAASRTPNTTPSSEGPDWVTFAPPRLDRYGVDRATAWFELGHRLAAEAPRAN